MTLKQTFLIAICLLFITSSCEENDDNTETTDSITLTETNYFYENDAYVYALNIERDQLIESIENGTSNDPDADQTRIETINLIIETTTTSIGFGLPPLPIPPAPCLCWDIWNEQKFIIADNTVFAIEATIISENEELIYSANTLGESLNINGFDIPAKAYSFSVEQNAYSGPATLSITKINTEGDQPITYSVPIFIE